MDTVRSRLEEQDRQDLVTSTTTITKYLTNQKSDGTWPDIDYANTSVGNWGPANHPLYMARLAAAYRTQGNTYYQSAAVLQAVSKALEAWVSAKLVSSNWWYNDIGVPMYLGPTLLLLQSKLTGAQITAGAALLPSTPQMTGENRVWYSFGSIHRAFLENNPSAVSTGVDAIKSVLVVESTAADGIQIDQTFYQHSTQIYNGGYGLQFVYDVSKWIGVLAGTSLSIDSTAKSVLDNLVIEGTGWMQWHGQIDYSTMGRNLSRNGTNNARSSLSSALQRMLTGSSARTAELQTLLGHVQGSSAGAIGQKHFWRGDYTAQRSANALVSLRLFSKRTVGSEYGNGENALGLYQGFGTNLIYRTGTEYSLIFPAWNWNRIPGTTLEQLASIPVPTNNTYIRGTQTFVGGVSDGQIGLSAFLQDETTNTAKAHKSWFFFGNGYLALGAGIHASGSGTVFTTLNQCLLNGTVRASQNGAASTLTRGEADLNNVNWLLHDQVGYIFPAPTRVHVKNTSQTGDWHIINSGYPSSAVNLDVFLAGLDHGTNPTNASYTYFVVPAVDETATSTFAASNPVTILSNTASLQAARHKDGFSGIAFFDAGSVALNAGLTVSASSPILLLVHELTSGLVIDVADPTQLLTTVQLAVTGHYKGPNTSYDTTTNSTRITVTLPTALMAGSTLELDLPNG